MSVSLLKAIPRGEHVRGWGVFSPAEPHLLSCAHQPGQPTQCAERTAWGPLNENVRPVASVWNQRFDQGPRESIISTLVNFSAFRPWVAPYVVFLVVLLLLRLLLRKRGRGPGRGPGLEGPPGRRGADRCGVQCDLHRKTRIFSPYEYPIYLPLCLRLWVGFDFRAW